MPRPLDHPWLRGLIYTMTAPVQPAFMEGAGPPLSPIRLGRAAVRRPPVDRRRTASRIVRLRQK
ncbi:hypothetical protein ACIBQ1_14015 [Nonomuraea sp. NPDC050153]|uniref:hypothetical protein n=1 Tax=Nonomuraea sp. NPDC050153 TaxID=3364359 RepID=UPI0037B10633